MFRIINSIAQINYILYILRGENLSAAELNNLQLDHIYKESLFCDLILSSEFSDIRNINRINNLPRFNIIRVVNTLCYYTQNQELISECQELKRLSTNFDVLMHIFNSDQFSIVFRRMYSFSQEFLSDNKIIFLHIPKTAGTFLEGIFSSNYGDRCYIERKGVIDIKAYKAAKIIGGHLPLSCYNHSDKHVYLSIIRNPIERCLSLLNYYSSNRDGQLKYRIARGFNLKDPIDTITNSDFKYMFRNEMCYYLSSEGCRSFYSALRSVKEKQFFIGHAEYINEFMTNLTDKFDLEMHEVSQQNRAPNLNYLDKYYANRDLIDLLESYNLEDIKLEKFCKEHVVISNLCKLKKYN